MSFWFIIFRCTTYLGRHYTSKQPIKVTSNPYTCFHEHFFDIFLLFFEAQNRLKIQQEDKDLTKFGPFQGIPYFLPICLVLAIREFTLLVELIYNNAWLYCIKMFDRIIGHLCLTVLNHLKRFPDHLSSIVKTSVVLFIIFIFLRIRQIVTKFDGKKPCLIFTEMP